MLSASELNLTAQRMKSAQSAIGATFFLSGFVALTYIPRVPEIIEQIDVSFAIWGLIIGVAGIGSLIPLLFVHRLVSRFGTSPVIRVSSLMICFSIASLAWTEIPFVYFLLNLMLTFSMSAFNIGLNSQSVMLQKKLDKVVIGKFHASWSIGATVSAAVSKRELKHGVSFDTS